MPNNLHCSVENCSRPVDARGWCHTHYLHWWKIHRDPNRHCAVEDCVRPVHAKGRCRLHDWRWQHYGDPFKKSIRSAGEGSPDSSGYWRLTRNGERVRRSVVIVEAALGKRLPGGAEVHHVDGDRSGDRPGNLVACESRGYHTLLHQRSRALRACGHANWRSCNACKTYDAPENLVFYARATFHPRCNARRKAE
jgi:hypothetical protein